jgi:hypothetical protein
MMLSNSTKLKLAIAAITLLFTNGLKAQDWANIKHYTDANSKVPPPAPGEKE